MSRPASQKPHIQTGTSQHETDSAGRPGCIGFAGARGRYAVSRSVQNPKTQQHAIGHGRRIMTVQPRRAA